MLQAKVSVWAAFAQRRECGNRPIVRGAGRLACRCSLYCFFCISWCFLRILWEKSVKIVLSCFCFSNCPIFRTNYAFLTPLNVVLSGLSAYQNIVYSILPIYIVPARARVRVYSYVYACVQINRYALDMVIFWTHRGGIISFEWVPVTGENFNFPLSCWACRNIQP